MIRRSLLLRFAQHGKHFVPADEAIEKVNKMTKAWLQKRGTEHSVTVHSQDWDLLRTLCDKYEDWQPNQSSSSADVTPSHILAWHELVAAAEQALKTLFPYATDLSDEEANRNSHLPWLLNTEAVKNSLERYLNVEFLEKKWTPGSHNKRTQRSKGKIMDFLEDNQPSKRSKQ